MNKILLPTLAIMCTVFCSQVAASPVTWEFNGIVDEGNHNGFFFPFAVAAGDPVTVDLSFEPGTPCSTCSPTANDYLNPLTALSFTANGTRFALPLTSSGLLLAKDEATPSGAFLNLFDLNFAGFDSSSEIFYQGNLDLQSIASMPPVPGIDDVNLTNLLPPDPAAFVSAFPGVDTNFFDVGAAQGHGFNSFGGRLLTSSVRAVPEFDAASIGTALTLLLGGLTVLRGRRRLP